jgi:formamidopyrimidine-DNA glycosylase
LANHRNNKTKTGGIKVPELPEMENYKHLLNQKIGGKTITHIKVNRQKSINIPNATFESIVNGKRVINVSRRAKHLLFHLENEYILLLHLMLGGWIYFGPETEKPERTIQVQLTFGEQSLYFIGLRLGYLHIYSQDEVNQKLSELGPEPLSTAFTVDRFLQLMNTKRGRLKTALVDQQFISGIGNCYSDEICHHARILPVRNISALSENEKVQLFHSIRHVLTEATVKGGYMDQPLFQHDRLTGGFDDLCKVYDRANEPCIRCGSTIKLEKISSRKTFYCNGCQR